MILTPIRTLVFPDVSFPSPEKSRFRVQVPNPPEARRSFHPRRNCRPYQMGKLRRMLPVIPAHGSFFNTVPQLDYVSLLHTEEAFTTFVNACAQAGAIKCLPVGMIQGNATGSDVRTLITSTLDVGLFNSSHLSCKTDFGPIARPEATEGRIRRTPGPNRRA